MPRWPVAAAVSSSSTWRPCRSTRSRPIATAPTSVRRSRHLELTRAAKYGMFPKSQAQKDLADWRVKATDPMCVADPQSALIASNILATTLADFHADHEAVCV